MKSSKKNVALRAFALGVMTGMRSMSGPWLVSYRANKERRGFKGTWLGWLSYPQVRGLFTLMEVGELIADKTPNVPARINPQPLMGRIALGAFVGLATYTEAGKSPVVGAVIGAGGSIASTFFFYNARKSAVSKTGLPDLVFAVMEDVAMAGIGLGVLKLYE